MKKLMFAIAAAVFAVGAQANNVDWSLQLSAVPKSGADTSTYTAYFFDKATFDAGVTGTTIEQSLLSSALDSSTFYLKSAGSSSDQYMTGKSASEVLVRTITGLGSSAMDYYMVLVSSDNKYSIAASGNTPPYDPMAAGSPVQKSTTWAKMQGTASSGNLTWGTVNVPEPTSGILMLVGLSALALRRRKA